VLTGIEFRKAAERGDGHAAAIHVGLGFEDPDRHALPGALRFAGALAPAKLSHSPSCRDMIGEPKPGVVASVLVLRAGIPQPHDRVQVRVSVRLRPRPRASASG
jgi:hypothetical protein